MAIPNVSFLGLPVAKCSVCRGLIQTWNDSYAKLGTAWYCRRCRPHGARLFTFTPDEEWRYKIAEFSDRYVCLLCGVEQICANPGPPMCGHHIYHESLL